MIFGLEAGEFAAILALLFAGTIVLVPVLAISARLAMKPMIEALARLRQSGQETTLQDRRIALLEAEVHHLSAAVHHFAEVEDFRRQIAVPPIGVEHRA
ncbi:MAG TPA: hypothetical protein VGB15_11855 [Longimicrobium sp.]|jgi:hypothetical protein